MAGKQAQQKNARPKNASIDKLIEFFKSLKNVSSGTGQSITGQPIDPGNDVSRHQTEEEYQAEQVRWLAGINAGKRTDKPKSK